MKLPFLLLTAVVVSAQSNVPRYGIFEASHDAAGSYSNPYLEVTAEAVFTRPDGATWRIPLFWDGGQTFRVRVSPDLTGPWSYRVQSSDPGLQNRSGRFVVIPSTKAGGLVTRGSHFARQNGDAFFFLGDTAWSYFTDVPGENHARPQAEAYARARAAQGFNVIHSMLLSEGGDGNSGGPPWHSIGEEKINPAYFREAESRIAFANGQGLTVGVALAWGNKGRGEKFPWGLIPGRAARERYARYVAARLAAYDTYFLISGEWHAELRTRPKESEAEIFREFLALGDAFRAAEPHHRLVGIHPMTAHGSVREFTIAPWMSFADYQQNYSNLHGRAVLSRGGRGPVVNSEYSYHLRDQNGDGHPDKDNSYSLEDMRHASWDIALAGAYLVTGFGTTYFGGRRDPGPFDLDAAKNRDWETQIGYLKSFFSSLPFERLLPADELVSSALLREGDWFEAVASAPGGRAHHPPKLAYWCLAIPGETYVAYVRGASAEIHIDLGARARTYRIRQFNPRTGSFETLSETLIKARFSYRPPDSLDWVVLLEATD
jgi:hypothetical protein